jgi:hypothetical protein
MMQQHRIAIGTFVVAVMVVAGTFVEPVRAQFGSTSAAPRPSGQVSVYTNVAHTKFEGDVSRDFQEISMSATYSLPERDSDGLVYGIDLRHSHDASGGRSDRFSVYEGYVGARAAGGRMMMRGGHVWLNELGGLGSLAGGTAEVRTRPDILTGVSSVRAGGFAGLEPNVFVRGYVDDVRKYGGYVTFEGEHARRQSVGLVRISHASLTERSVVTATNFLPVGRKLFMYQAAEVDLSAPGGQSHRGLNYFLTNVRVAPTLRLDLQGNFTRGRSIDSRGITEDSLNGRTVTPATIEGFLYESMGGRVSVEVLSGVRLNAGYARDKNNRDDRPTSRVTFGGYAGNVAKSGFDISGSDSYVDRATGPYHSRYISVGRQLGQAVYLSGDVSTSLAVLRFSRSDGVVVEMRPHTTRLTGSAVVNVSRTTSLLVTVDRTVDDGSRDLRVLSGITYRLR